MKRALQTIVITLMLFGASCSRPAQPESRPGTAQGGGGNANQPAGAAREGASTDPTAAQIIDRYAEAIGGTDASRRISSLEARGSFEMPETGVRGTVEVYTKAPDRMMFQLRAHDGSFSIAQGYDGTNGWQHTLSRSGARSVRRDLNGAELAELKLRSDFLREFKLKELYPLTTLKGRELVDERETYVVEAKPPAGKSITMYFDTKSGLLVREDTPSETEEREAATETYYDDYREVDGIRLAFTQSTIYPEPENNLIIRFSEVRTNTSIPDSIFEKPKK